VTNLEILEVPLRMLPDLGKKKPGSYGMIYEGMQEMPVNELSK